MTEQRLFSRALASCTSSRKMALRFAFFLGLLLPLWGSAFFVTTNACAEELPETAALTPAVLSSLDGHEQALSVEIADTERRRATGLMFRTRLAPNSGMLFLFPRAQPVRMWMKNTLIPLDMLFFDPQGTVIHIEENVQPHDLTPRGPDSPAAAVLELAGGSVAAHGFGLGSHLRWPATPGRQMHP